MVILSREIKMKINSVQGPRDRDILRRFRIDN